MSILSKYQTFLKAHITQNKDTITHTRIGDRDSKIYGGAYSILDSELDEFYSLYTKAVIDANKTTKKVVPTA